MALKWCGIDFGQSLMEPRGLRTYWVIGDVYKELGKPEKISEAMRKFRVLVEAVGNHNELKEAYRAEINAYVFEGDEEAIELFNIKEKDYMDLAEGAREALHYMKEHRVSANIVAELKRHVGEIADNVISRFLKTKGVIDYFDCVYTPQGGIDLRDGSIDESYRGKTKESGELYRRLLEELGERGIKPEEMLVVGDNIATDIRPPHRLGIKTVQYIGYEDMGPSEADFRVTNFYELKEILERMRE